MLVPQAHAGEANKKQENSAFNIPSVTEQPSAYVTLTQKWASINVSETLKAEVLQKGELFLAFLSSIRLHPLNWKPEDDHFDISKDHHNYEKR
jgi:hypothetical protein